MPLNPQFLIVTPIHTVYCVCFCIYCVNIHIHHYTEIILDKHIYIMPMTLLIRTVARNTQVLIAGNKRIRAPKVS